MTKLNLQKILEDFVLDPREVAQVLFPTNRYKLQALKRLIKDNVPLNIEQLDALAEYLNLLPAQLLQYGLWEGRIEDHNPVLLLGPIVVRLLPTGCYISQKGNEQIRIADSDISLDNLINKVTKHLESWNQSRFKSI